MSEKEFEECTLAEATHVEMDGLIYTFGDGNVEKIAGGLNVYMKHWDNCLSIFANAFSVLGIKPMREKKRKPIEFEATFAKHDGQWHPLYKLGRWIFVSELQDGEVQVC